MDKTQYFMQLAEAVAKRSKDHSSKVGCVIVDEDDRIVSTGYNGFVSGCDESHMTQERPMKYHLVVHSEMNAILFARRNLKGCRLYCTHAPCDNCLKHILQAGIREIVYSDSSIMRRTDEITNKAILRQIISTGAIVHNVETDESYVEEILQHLNQGREYGV